MDLFLWLLFVILGLFLLWLGLRFRGLDGLWLWRSLFIFYDISGKQREDQKNTQREQHVPVLDDI